MKFKPADTTDEISELRTELWLKKRPQERTQFASAMSLAARNVVLESLPEGLSEEKITEQLPMLLYGEPLPEDFFTQRNG